jgi:hypothetical protein
MAQERVRTFSVRVRGKKIATGTGKKYQIMSNGEDLITEEGWVGQSDGPITTSLEVNTIVPINPRDMDVVTKILLGQEYAEVHIGVLAGNIHAISMRFKSVEHSTDDKTGAHTGVIQASGGAPKIISGGLG